MSARESNHHFVALLLTTIVVPILLSSTTEVAAQDCVQPPPELFSWWPGDGNGSDLVSGRDAVLFGEGFAAGVVGQAFALDGVDDIIQIPFDAPFDFPSGSSISIAAWIHPTSIEVPPGFTVYSGPVLAKGQDNGSRNWWFALGGDDGRASLGFTFSSATGLIQYSTSASPILAGSWHHVAVSYVFGDAGSINIYLNGEPVPGSWTAGAGNETPLLNDFFPRIGGEEDPRANDHFAGYIDEVELYSQALSECQVRSIFLAGAAGHCKGDSDSDGLVDIGDNCPVLPNSDQMDTDSDGAGDACDCAPVDPGVFSAPMEVGGLRLGALGSRDRLDWCEIKDDTGPVTRYDICRGSVEELPVGGGPSEVCVQDDHGLNSIDDAAVPAERTSFWYLVRGQNACGTGTYGYASDGGERITLSCP